ncbi:MAG: metallophosphoesterase [Paludibacteraceae bacterium]|nr:metallophosphoesterase [Paludibacteraceae bacterium]
MRQLAFLRQLAVAAAALLLSGCEFNPVRFVWTDTDVNLRFEQSRAYEAQHPHAGLTLASEYRFAVASDLHLRQDNAPVVAFHRQLNEAQADFVVYNGDLYNGKPAFADFAKEALESDTDVPVFYVCGNHDLYYGWETFFDRFGGSSYTFDVTTAEGTDRYFVLESASATLGQEQFQWLQQALQQAQGCRYRIVLTHNNFTFGGDTNGMFSMDELDTLWALFAEYRVHLVISGHSHREDDSEILGVRYLTTGAFKNGDYGWCRVSAQGLQFDFRHFDYD